MLRSKSVQDIHSYATKLRGPFPAQFLLILEATNTVPSAVVSHEDWTPSIWWGGRFIDPNGDQGSVTHGDRTIFDFDTLVGLWCVKCLSSSLSLEVGSDMSNWNISRKGWHRRRFVENLITAIRVVEQTVVC